MPAYIMVDITIHDMEKLGHYVEEVPKVIEKYGGRYLVRGGETEVLEGSLGHPLKVVLEFPDAATARAWYNSEEYAALKQERLAVSEGNMVLVEGL